MQLPTEVEISSHRAGIGKYIVKYKKLVRKLVGPYLRNVFEKEHAMLEERFSQIDHRAEERHSRTERWFAGMEHSATLAERYSKIEARLDAIEQHLPTLLNYISSFTNATRQIKRQEGDSATSIKALQEGLEYLTGRVEFVRNEMLFEFKYGENKAAVKDGIADIKVLNESKLVSMQDNIRVNVGCGHIPMEGYLNVDMRELPGVDITAPADKLPFEENSLSEIFSSHLIEHFPQEELKRKILPHWHGLLKKNGILRAVLPDAEAMIENYTKGDYPFEKLRNVTFGAQEYDGDFHFNMFSRQSIKGLLEEAGFRDVSYAAAGRVNGDCYEMEIAAVK
ncbi:MAG: hypothetical protein HY954_05160 [Deltaproteobacteria bacterium]|nr:hypothetical protein [Deltaproteobacteria bacterium]